MLKTETRRLVEANVSRLSALCREHQVRRLALFGSALRADFDPHRSGLDFVVEFLPLAPSDHRHAYFGLLAALENLVGRSVDLVEWAAVENPYLRQTIQRTQETLYAAE